MEKLFKNISKLFVVTLVIALVSCGGDDEVIAPVLPDGPTITIVSDQLSASASYEATAGEEISFSVTVNAPGGFNNYTAKSGSQTIISESKDSGTTVTTFTSNQTTIIPTTEDLVGQTISIEITAVDDNNKTSTVTVEFTVVSVPLNVFSAQMLAAPLGDLSAASFFSSNTGTLYAPATVNASNDPLSNDIDFGYYYGTNDNASIASPAGFLTITGLDKQVSSWGTKNSTTLLATTMTSAEFTETTTLAALETSFASGTDGSEFKTSISVGDVIAFQTNSTKTNSPGKKGLILIKAINGTDGENDNIEIDVLVEK